jgi:hypothetical protein
MCQRITHTQNLPKAISPHYSEWLQTSMSELAMQLEGTEAYYKT